MSESTGGAGSASSPWGGGQPRRDFSAIRTALQRITSTLLLATAGIVVAVLVEPVFIWRTTPPVFAARSGLGDEVRARGWSTPTTAGRYGGRRPPDELLALRGDDGPVPDATLSLLERLGLVAGDDPDRLETVIARRSVALFDRAESDGREVLRVDEGTPLKLVRSVGDWGLVMAAHADRVMYGWVRLSALSKR